MAAALRTRRSWCAGPAFLASFPGHRAALLLFCWRRNAHCAHAHTPQAKANSDAAFYRAGFERALGDAAGQKAALDMASATAAASTASYEQLVRARAGLPARAAPHLHTFVVLLCGRGLCRQPPPPAPAQLVDATQAKASWDLQSSQQTAELASLHAAAALGGASQSQYNALLASTAAQKAQVRAGRAAGRCPGRQSGRSARRSGLFARPLTPASLRGPPPRSSTRSPPRPPC